MDAMFNVEPDPSVEVQRYRHGKGFNFLYCDCHHYAARRTALLRRPAFIAIFFDGDR